MITKEQAQNIKAHVENILVYNELVTISSENLKEDSDPNVKALWKYSHEQSSANAEKAGKAFLSYIDSLTEATWIDWPGGECPVDDFTKVEYRTSQGSEEIQPAYNLRWTWNGGNTPRGGDIIAYRVVEDEECPECREIEQRRERLIKEVEKSIAELLFSSKNRLGVELPELSEEDKENRILRVNFVVNPEK